MTKNSNFVLKSMQELQTNAKDYIPAEYSSTISNKNWPVNGEILCQNLPKVHTSASQQVLHSTGTRCATRNLRY